MTGYSCYKIYEYWGLITAPYRFYNFTLDTVNFISTKYERKRDNAIQMIEYKEKCEEDGETKDIIKEIDKVDKIKEIDKDNEWILL